MTGRLGAQAPLWQADGSFAPVLEAGSGRFFTVLPLANGKVIVAGTALGQIIGGQRVKGTLARVNGDGSLDPAFVAPEQNLYPLAAYADGELLVQRNVGGTSSAPSALLRLRADGSIDSSFNALAIDHDMACVRLLPAGRIVVAGPYTAIGGTQRLVAVLEADGSLAADFHSPFVEADGRPFTMNAEPAGDGRFWIFGDFGRIGGNAATSIARLNADGSVDDTFHCDSAFSPMITRIYPQPDGTLYAASGGTLVRLSATGGRDTTFNSPLATRVKSFGPQDAAGRFYYLNLTSNQIHLAAADGSNDTLLCATELSTELKLPVVAADGASYVVDALTLARYYAQNAISRVTAAGVIDDSFFVRAASAAQVAQIEGQADGKIIVAGNFSRVNGVVPANPLVPVRLNPDGTTDPTFTAEMATAAAARQTSFGVTDAAGRRYLLRSNGTVGRLTTAGADDPTFQSDIPAMLSSPVAASSPFAVAADGTVFLIARGDRYGSYEFVRLLSDGSRDPGFTANGNAVGYFNSLLGLLPLPDGRTLLFGTQLAPNSIVLNCVRLDRTGAVDYRYISPPGNSSGVSPTDVFTLAGVICDLLRDAKAPADYHAHVALRDTAVLDVTAAGTATISITIWASPASFARYTRAAPGELTIDPRPTLTFQPSGSRSYIQGAPMFLNVTAGGLFPLSYQWLKDGVPISGATGSSFVQSSFQPTDAGSYSVLVTNASGWIVSHAVPVTLNSDTVPLALTQPLRDQNLAVGDTLQLTVAATANPAPTFTWTFNGAPITPTGSGSAGSGSDVSISSSLVLPHFQPAQAGVYRVVASDGHNTQESVAIVGMSSIAKASGDAEVVALDIHHPNGNTYDQVLLTGPAATITADPGKVTRLSYIDLSDDIVQVEFSGAGALTVALDPDTYSGPVTAVNYNQPNVRYVRGHATITIAGADATTNASFFTVGKVTAVNPALFKDVTYDGVADIASVSIASASGQFGGLRTGNTSYVATKGIAGVYAPAVQFLGPVIVGDITAADDAVPMLVLDRASDVRLAGGSLEQIADRSVQVSGFSYLNLTAGATSHGDLLPAKSPATHFVAQGVDVTALLLSRP